MKQIKVLDVCLLGVVALTGCSVNQEGGESITDFQEGDVTYYPAGPSFAVFFLFFFSDQDRLWPWL